MTRKNCFIIPLLASLLIFNAVLLDSVGVNILRQTLTLIVLALIALGGRALLGEKNEDQTDPIFKWIVCFLLGMGVFAGANFVLLHLGPKVSLAGSLVLLGVGALYGLRFVRPQTTGNRITPLGAPIIITCILIAIIIGAGSFYGFYNNPKGPAKKNRFNPKLAQEQQPQANWGWNADKRWWLIVHPEQINPGLPGESFLHEGVPIFYMALAGLTGGNSPQGRAECYKATALPLLFCLFYCLGWMTCRVFKGPQAAGILAIISLPLFAPINYQYLAGDHPWILAFFNIWGPSSYLGFFSAGAGIHHNVTFFLGFLIGIGGLACILRSLQNQAGLLIPGSALVAISLLFKPSFYSIAVPALIIVGLWEQTLPGKTKLKAVSLLVMAPILWFFYPKIFGIPTLESNVGWNPFAVIAFHAAHHFPPELGRFNLLIGGIVTLLSFAIFVPLIFIKLGRLVKSPQKFRPISWLKNNKAQLTIILIFLTGIASYAFLAQEGPMFRHANLSWGAGMAYGAILPLLAATMVRMKSIIGSMIAWPIYLLHLWGGIYHLYRFFFLGRIR